jgi:hypothetical protein
LFATFGQRQVTLAAHLRDGTMGGVPSSQHALGRAIRTSPEKGLGYSLVSTNHAPKIGTRFLRAGFNGALAAFSGFPAPTFRVFHDRFMT